MQQRGSDFRQRKNNPRNPTFGNDSNISKSELDPLHLAVISYTANPIPKAQKRRVSFRSKKAGLGLMKYIIQGVFF